MLRRLLLILFLLLIGARGADARSVALATLEWEPYIGLHLVENGYVAAIVREAFRASGYESVIVFFPWKRSVEMTRRGKYNALFPEYFDEERLKDFVYSDPFPGGPLVAFTLRDNPQSIDSLEDFRGKRVGVVRGYVNTAEFDRADWIKKDEAVDDLENLRKLEAGRVDVVVMDEYVGRHLARQYFGDEDLLQVAMELEQKDLYVAFPRAREDHEALLQLFNEGLRQLRDEGRIRQIMGRHGFLFGDR